MINLNLKEMSNKEWDRKSYAQSEALNALHEESVIIYREKVPERRGQVKDDTEVGKTGIDWFIEAVDITENNLIFIAEDIDEIVLDSTYNDKDECGIPVGFSFSSEVLEKLVDLEGLLVNASYQLSLFRGLLETGDEQKFLHTWKDVK